MLSASPMNPRLQVVLQASVDKGFTQALVRVFQGNVFANDADRNFVEGIMDALHQHLPWLHVPLGLREVKQTHDLSSRPSALKTRGTS